MTSKRGFTLIEVTVGLAITALVLIGFGYILRDAAGMRHRLDTGVSDGTEIEGVFRIVEQLLGGVEYEYSASEGTQPTGLSIVGRNDRIRILGRSPPVLGLPGRTAFELGSHPVVSGRAVYLSWENSGKRHRESLMGEAASLRFRYGQAINGSIVWQDSWEQPIVNLALLKVEISQSPTARGRVRTVIVKPMLPALCATRPLTPGCPRWN